MSLLPLSPSSRLIPHLTNERRSWLAGGILAIVQMTYFLPGYRLSADDQLFLGVGLLGWESVIDFSWLIATGQGRIGGLLLVPLNVAGAYLQDFLLSRIIILLIDFGFLALFAIWVAKLARFNFAGALFSVLMGCYVLGFFHLPPNAFPLQNLVPFVILIAVRFPPWTNISWLILRMIPTMAAMLVSEYALIFATAILIAEYLTLIYRKSFTFVASTPAVWFDLISTALPFAAYLIWRSHWPSGYEGNQLSFIEPSAFLYTWVLHSFALSGMPLLLRGIINLPFVLEAIIYGLIFMAAIVRSDFKNIPPRVGQSLVLGGLLFALYVTLPVSLTQRQQDWCVHSHSCLFLDSRVAYYGVGTSIFGCFLLLQHRRITRLFAICVLAGFVPMVSLWNQSESSRMNELAVIWSRAAKLSCVSGPITGDMIDPNKQIFMHKRLYPEVYYTGRDVFWERYTANIRPSCSK